MNTAVPKPQQQEQWINERTVGKIIPLNGNTASSVPFSKASEEQLVGSILTAGETGKGTEAFKRVAYIRYLDMYCIATGYIWRAFEKIVAEGLQINLTTLKNRLALQPAGQKPLLEQIGGEGYLLGLMRGGGTNMETHASDVFKASCARELMALGPKLEAFGQKGMNLDIREYVPRLETLQRPIMNRIASFSQRDRADLSSSMSSHLDVMLKQADDITYEPGMKTGLANFDKITLGLAWLKLYLFAAPQGWGKTALLLNLAVAMLRSKRKVKFNTLEMPREEIIERMLSMMALVKYTDIRERKLSAGEILRLKRAREEVMDNEVSKNFIIQRFQSPTLEELEAAVLNDQMNFAPDVQFIDWLGIDNLTIPERDENRASALMYKKLKSWKESLGPAFVAAAQMNSGWDRKKDKRPSLLSIRYGTVAVNAADFEGFIYHESLVKQKSKTTDAELVVPKNRCGPGGEKLRLMMNWQKEFLRFSTDSTSSVEGMDEEEAS